MLGTVDVYTSEPSVDTLDLAALPELDILKVIDIQGLDPVKISVNTTSLASVDGEDEVGTTVPSRNIVLTLRGDPDYSNWTPYSLRQLIYQYFTPKNKVRLVFSKGQGAADPDRPTFTEMLRRHPEYFQTSWLADHDFGSDLAWNGELSQYPVCILRPEGTGGNLFVAETDVGSFTGSDEPDWSSAPSVGDSVYDNYVTWYNVGPASSFPPAESTWTPSTSKEGLAFVWPTTPNGHLYIKYPGYDGLTGEDEPEWSTIGDYSNDNDVYWWDMGPGPVAEQVEIFGRVESCEADSFSPEMDYVVSIICPDPYFTAVDPVIVNGSTATEVGTDAITSQGTVPVGFFLTVTKNSDDATFVNVKVGNFDAYFNIVTDVNDSKRLEMDTRAKKKMIRQVDVDTATAVSALGGLQDGSTWPLLEKGDNAFSVLTDTGGQDYEVKYWPKYSGL